MGASNGTKLGGAAKFSRYMCFLSHLRRPQDAPRSVYGRRADSVLFGGAIEGREGMHRRRRRHQVLGCSVRALIEAVIGPTTKLRGRGCATTVRLAGNQEY
jgi:hypothetical protein